MPPALRKTLGLTELTFYGVGTIVGAGIYSVIGPAAGQAGEGLWLSFLLASLVAFTTVLAYAELTSMYSRAGAEYQFLKAAFPRLRVLAFAAGYLIAFNAAATSATVALAFDGYLQVFLDLPAGLAAFALIAGCMAINIAGIRQSTFAAIALICVEVAGLLIFIGAGLSRDDFGAALTQLPGDVFAGVLPAVALVFFVFIGFEDIANLSEEARAPRRDLPRALLLSFAITAILYFLVALSALALSSPDELAQSAHPLTTAAEHAASLLGPTLAIAALFSTASTALIALVSISRLLFGMARDGDMPRMLARTWSARQTPWVAALALGITACALLPLGRIELLASLSSFGVIIVFGAIQVAVIVRRYSAAERPRSFKVPVNIGRFPLPCGLGLLLCVLLLTQFEPIVYGLMTGVIGFAALLFVWWRGKTRR